MHPFIFISVFWNDFIYNGKIPQFLRVLSKMEYVKTIENGGSKMADASDSFLVINDVVMASLLLLKVIHMLANFLIL